MAEEPRPLTLRYSSRIEPRLAEIWQWNADRYGEAHADEYVTFLRAETRSLQINYLKGRTVPQFPTYRHISIQTRTKSHGYVVVYEVRATEIYVFYYFHTAQDWQNQLIKMLQNRREQ